MDFAEHSDLTGRLRGLVIMLGEGLSLDQARATDERIDRSDFGAALETLADWLGDQQTPIPDSIREDFERLSNRLGDRDRVMGPLERCPTERDPSP